jgi:prophage antirepressor-like protein
VSDLMIFRYEEQPVRSVLVNGEPWFVGKDIAEILGYANTRKAVSDHCKRPRPIGRNDSLPPIDPQTAIIPEGDVYRLIMRSNMPAAEQFEAWVTEEVIPSIRRDGMYATPDLLNNPEHLLRVTQRLVEEHQARLAAQAKVEELAPKAEFHDAVASTEGCQSIGDVAKVLGTGQNRLFAWLRSTKILMADNLPYQNFLDVGYFRVIEQTWTDREGEVHLTTKTLVTGKGLTWLQRRFHSRETGLDVIRRESAVSPA